MAVDGRTAAANLDAARVEDAIRSILVAVGEDPAREGLQGTPKRIARMYADIFSGLYTDPVEILRVGFDQEEHDEMVVLRDIPFYSMCEHHLLPFHGIAHVGYLPEGRLVGISKIARVVEAFAKRPQVQERLTTQIADCIMNVLQPQGVGVVMAAEHLCMTMRGVRKPGSRMVTSAMRGTFRRRPATRAEFLSLVGES